MNHYLLKHRSALQRGATLLAIFGLLLGLVGCAGQPADEASEEVQALAVPVETMTVVVEPFTRQAKLGGLLAARSTVNVMAKVGGMEEVKAIHVKVGDHVGQGTVLAELDRESSRIQIEGAQLSYDDALRNLERMMPLLEAGAISQAEVDRLQLAVDAAANQLNSLQLALQYKQVVSPIAGTVVNVYAEVGGFASAGAPMFQIADVDVLEVSTGINEKNINKLHIGQEVTVYVAALPEGDFTGKIKEISKVMDMTTKKYPITISLANKGKLMAGMYAEVSVVTDHLPEAMVVPTDALIYRDNGYVVFLEVDGQVVERSITVGLNDGERYVVTEGLAAGEQLIIKGNTDIVADQAVLVVRRDGQLVGAPADVPSVPEEEMVPEAGETL